MANSGTFHRYLISSTKMRLGQVIISYFVIILYCYNYILKLRSGIMGSSENSKRNRLNLHVF